MRFDRQNIEYFLNAIHYCMWLHFLKFEEKNDRRYNRFLSFVLKYFCTQKVRNRYYNNLKRYQIDKDKFYHDKKSGYCIGWAHHWFGWFYSDFACFVSFILIGLLFKFDFEIGHTIIIMTFALPVGLAYIPAYNAVFKKDKYLAYFKQFEKEDEQWHKKWKRKTMLFCFGGTTIFILGIVTIFFIASL